MKAFRVGFVLLSMAASIPASAQSAAKPLRAKLGVLTDMTGPFADQAGRGSVIATQLAVEDFLRERPDANVEVVSADHQNKPDIGAAIARRWVELDGVTAVVDLPNSGVALAVAGLMKEKNRVTLASISASSALTGPLCAPTTVQWMSDTWAQSSTTVKAVARQTPGDWFFLTVDYALGIALEKDATDALGRAGRKALGSVRIPLGTADFASALLTAQSSGAKVMALANSGTDAINTVKQMQEFGLSATMQPAALFMLLSDVAALGPASRKGLLVTTSFYWDLNDETRAFAKRFAPKNDGKMPTEGHAAAYSASLHYLRSLAAMPGAQGADAVEAMRTTPIKDPLFGTTEIRADGRAIHPMYLFRVKGAESTGTYDLYTLVDTVPADEAFRPLRDGGCPLVK